MSFNDIYWHYYYYCTTTKTTRAAGTSYWYCHICFDTTNQKQQQQQTAIITSNKLSFRCNWFSLSLMDVLFYYFLFKLYFSCQPYQADSLVITLMLTHISVSSHYVCMYIASLQSFQQLNHIMTLLLSLLMIRVCVLLLRI